MKITSKVQVTTKGDSIIEKGTSFIVDYFDDDKGIVWLKTENVESPAGEMYVSIECFNAFFEKSI